MRYKFQPCRRTFLKTSAVGAAGALVTVGAVPDALAQETSSWPATGYLQINPNIDNCRVVYVTDPAFITKIGWTNWTDVNTNKLDFAKIKAAIDKMAMCLAKKATAHEAWATIFRKPTSKAWAQVKVAMKVNACGDLGPNAGAVGKLCEAIISVGALPANIGVRHSATAKSNTRLQTSSETSCAYHLFQKWFS